jgi:two-component system cell cycle sensor histidine kinase/response regulator CckA
MDPDEKILIVDDDRGVRSLCQLVLRTAGHSVLGAASGSEAKRIFSSEEGISMLITDVRMPGMSGPALVQDLFPDWPQLQVLYISGNTCDDDLLHQHVSTRGCRLLRKPFSPADLVAEVDAMRTI